jgi:hypothetical protein
MFRKIVHCRICGNADLAPIVHLGEQYLTGVFPRTPSEKITCGPLELVKCHGEKACGFVQLLHSFESRIGSQDYDFGVLSFEFSVILELGTSLALK